jgi:hypothetical protein
MISEDSNPHCHFCDNHKPHILTYFNDKMSTVCILYSDKMWRWVTDVSSKERGSGDGLLKTFSEYLLKTGGNLGILNEDGWKRFKLVTTRTQTCYKRLRRKIKS